MNTKYNWKEIQKDMDKGFTWSEIVKKWKCCMCAIKKAKDRGDLKTRNRKDASILAHKKYPNRFKHTQETKDKISKIRKEYILKNPDKVPYKLNHYSKGPSYPEQYFSNVFKKEGLCLISQFKFHTYSLDFADPIKKIDIEIDGNQHIFDKRIISHDEKRNRFMIDNGWCVYRILWSKFQKLSKQKKLKYIQNLIKEISGD